MLAAALIFLVSGLNSVSPLGTTLSGTTQSPAPPGAHCAAGEVWSDRSSRCCRICPPGTGATPPCTASPSDDDDLSSATVSSNTNSYNNSEAGRASEVCEACADGVSFSSNHSHQLACSPCSTCPKNARMVSACNLTHDTVCKCEDGLFLSERVGRCELCDLCPVGWGASMACGRQTNTVCRKCQNGTFSDVLDAVEACRPCRVCADGERMLQACTPTQDTICINLNIPPPYPINGNQDSQFPGQDYGSKKGYHINNGDNGQQHNRPPQDDDGDIDVIPLYCAALGAVVVGLLAYVAFVHYRRMRDKRLSREPHEDVEYSKASGADSGIFLDADHHHHHHKYHCAVITGSTRLRDLPSSKKKELEKMLMAGSRGPADWKGLARELGYNSGKIASFESRGSNRDVGAPFRQVMHDWGRLEGATVAVFLRALRNTGRHDVVKFLQSECTEQLQPLTGTLPHHVV